MARRPKPILGPSQLSKILANLRKSPLPRLANVRSLQMTLASRNDHFGARYVFTLSRDNSHNIVCLE